MDIFEKLPEALLSWYDAGHRELPWRQDKEPYHIWLSEIMLQQTRVEAVKGYYARFLQACPTVEALAECEDGKLHKLWEGLGYYSRVRNLKKAAREIMERHGGVFPREHSQVLALPGIGRYTAGAVCSIAFELPTPAVDGNVLRLVSRLTADKTPIDSPAFKAQVNDKLQRVYPRRAGDFTQALMELGATVCGPNRKPACENCPCRDFCAGYKEGTPWVYPVKSPKKEKRVEEKTVFILSCDGHFALQKRSGKGLLAGLWQFPNTQGKLDVEQALAWASGKGLRPREILRQTERQQIFTHIRWEMRGIFLEVHAMPEEFSWFTAEEIRTEAALPTAFRQFWEETV